MAQDEAKKSSNVSIIADGVAHIRPRVEGKTEDEITADFWVDWNARKEKAKLAPVAPVAASPVEPAPFIGDLEVRPRPTGRGWYDVYNAEGEKVNPTPMRKTAAANFVKEANSGERD